MPGKFVKSVGKDGKHYFALKAGNGETILQSQGYASTKSRDNGIESVRKNSQEPTRFEKKVASNGKFFFTLNATNFHEEESLHPRSLKTWGIFIRV